VELVSD